jgi:NAD(P)H-dependent FMN reductase
MAGFDCPSYNADVQRERGFPAGADELRRRLEASDAFVICSLEYNASMPGVLRPPNGHVAKAANRGWNPYGALSMQPVAIRGQSAGPKTRENKPNPLPLVAFDGTYRGAPDCLRQCRLAASGCPF